MKVLEIGILGGLAIGGYLVYKQMNAGVLNTNTVLSPLGTNSNLNSQPALQYPYQVAVPPRLDTSNQPWYGGSTAFNPTAPATGSSGIDQSFLNNVNYVKGFADISKSVAGIWDNLSGLFGTSAEPAPVASATTTSSIDWSFLS